MKQLDRQAVEWDAWQTVVREFGARAIDVNDPYNDSLIRAIHAWAELLVDLRVGQDQHVRDRARTEKITQYLGLYNPQD